jgi:outer membrane protein assembly factor BamB
MGRAALALLAVVAASCLKPPPLHTSARGAAAAPIPHSAMPQAAWINDDLNPIGQPLAVGAVVVGIVSAPEQSLLVVGLDPATGRKLWEQPLTPSSLTPGVRVGVAPVGSDRIAYFRPTPTLPGTPYAELVLADATTGADIAKSEPALFASAPHACDSSPDVCAIAKTATGTAWGTLRLVPATGRSIVERDPLPRGARIVGPGGLIDLGDRPGNTLALLREGRVWWRTPVSAAFPPGFSTDNGWSWNLYRDAHLFVGSVAGPSVHDGTRLVQDLGRMSATAALSERDGSVAWRDDGSSLNFRLEIYDAPVRCRSRGTRVSDAGGASESFRGLDVTLEGFDLATGKTTWSVPLGGDTLLVGGDARPPIAGPTQAVLNAPAGPIVVDVATGQVTRPAAGATFWCGTDRDYQFSPGFVPPDGYSLKFERPGGVLATICDANGHPAKALPPTAATLTIGARVGDHVVVAVKDGEAEAFVGFRVPPPTPQHPEHGARISW